MTRVRTFRSTPLAPYERGIEFGSLNRAEVARTVAAYHRLFAARADGPFDVAHWSAEAWRVIAREAPVAAEEIQGIADGADVPVTEIAALNARTELLALAGLPGVDECSTVVSFPAARAPVAVQTWDWYDAMADNWLHWTIPHPDGRVVETVTEYGVLGKIGVSSAGVGVLFNMLHHQSDGHGRIGYPVHLASRRVLDHADSLDDALDLLSPLDRSASTSLTVVAPGGGAPRAASVELFPEGAGVVEPEHGLLVRTNHFVSKEGQDGCQASTIGPGSQMRRTRLLETFMGEPPSTAAEVIAVMDHHAPVGAVCVHPDPATEPVLRHATLATVSIDVGDLALGVEAGGPCTLRS